MLFGIVTMEGQGLFGWDGLVIVRKDSSIVLGVLTDKNVMDGGKHSGDMDVALSKLTCKWFDEGSGRVCLIKRLTLGSMQNYYKLKIRRKM